jgi:hypothetical protein
MIAHHWDNWISSAELSKKLGISKRRANQILKFYFGLGIIEMSIMVKYPDEHLKSKVFTWSTYAAPIYRCKYSAGFETNGKET